MDTHKRGTSTPSRPRSSWRGGVRGAGAGVCMLPSLSRLSPLFMSTTTQIAARRTRGKSAGGIGVWTRIKYLGSQCTSSLLPPTALKRNPTPPPPTPPTPMLRTHMLTPCISPPSSRSWGASCARGLLRLLRSQGGEWVEEDEIGPGDHSWWACWL